MTEEQVLAYKAKTAKVVAAPEVADEGLEKTLMMKIHTRIKEKGFKGFHDRSRGVNEKGFLDWVVAMPKGRVVWLECKTDKGKLSPEQKATILQLKALGQEVYICRSFKKWLEIENGKV